MALVHMMLPPDFCEELRTFVRHCLVLAPAMSIPFSQFSLFVVDRFSRVESRNKDNHPPPPPPPAPRPQPP